MIITIMIITAAVFATVLRKIATRMMVILQEQLARVVLDGSVDITTRATFCSNIARHADPNVLSIFYLA